MGAVATSFTKLVVSHNDDHVIATTGEDKAIHVFTLDNDGQLEHLSQRYQAKYVCLPISALTCIQE